MTDDRERQFLLGIFLMEAWDTLATVEDGLGRLGEDGDGAAAAQPLGVVTHRLKGAAALHGFPGLSELAGAAEAVLERLAPASREARQQAAAFLGDLAGVLKTLLDGIGTTGQEDSDAIAAFRARYPVWFAPERPGTSAESAPRPADLGAGLAGELDRFFAENADILVYFAPEAQEHLEAMTRALLALERDGAAAEELGALFRAVHTLKGAAYTVGCAPVGDLAHRVEDLLSAVREERLTWGPAAIEAVFASVDALRLLLASAEGAPPELEVTVERAVAALAGVTPPAPAAVEAAAAPDPEGVALEPAAVEATATPGTPDSARELPPVAAEAPAPAAPVPVWPLPMAPRPGPLPPAARPPVRPGIRVNLERLDALMNLVGELVIARSRLDGRLAELDRVGELLGSSRTRMARAVKEFEGRTGAGGGGRVVPLGERGRPAAGRSGDGDGPTPYDELFAELEFDRYDDVDLLARTVAEISADLAEVQGELGALVRAVWDDTGQIQRLTGSLRGEITRARMVPIGRLFARFARQVREAARTAGKTVRLETAGEAVELDNTVIEQVADPLLHLVQNAVTHGIEPEAERQARGKPAHGTVTLRAYHRGGFVYVEVEDDGRGIDVDEIKAEAVRQGFVRPEVAAALDARGALHLIFLPGFSTAPRVTAASGRGVGMDVVRTNVSRLNGEIEVETEVGVGTRFTLRLPLTVVISDALLVRVGAERFAIPLNAVRVLLTVRSEAIRAVGRTETVRVDDGLVNLVRLDRALGLAGDAPSLVPVVVVRAAGRFVALAVDELLGKEEIVIKGLGGFPDGIGPFAGATISGEGRVILLVDPVRIVDLAERETEGRGEGAAVAEPATAAVAARDGAGARHVLLVDDSVSVRRFVGHMLERAGFEVLTAGDGAEALAQLAEVSVDVVITDLEMPRVNGYELIQHLRRRPAMRRLPIVVLTTRAGDKHVALARRLGVTHYVTKPVDERAFVGLVRSLAAGTAPVLAGVDA